MSLAGEDLGRAAGDAGADLAVGLVGGADPRAGIGFDDHVVARGHIFAHRARRQADAVFVDLDLLRHSDAHGGHSLFENVLLIVGEIRV